MDAFEKLMWALGKPDKSLEITGDFIEEKICFAFDETTLVPSVEINDEWYDGFRPMKNVLHLVYLMKKYGLDFDVVDTIFKVVDPVQSRIDSLSETVYYNGAIICDVPYFEPVELGIALERLRHGKSSSAAADISLWFRYVREGKWSRWRWSDGTETLFYRGHLVGPTAVVEVVNNHEIVYEKTWNGKTARFIIGPMANANIEDMGPSAAFERLVPGWVWIGGDVYEKKVGNLKIISRGDPRSAREYEVLNIFGETIGRIPSTTKLTLKNIARALG